MNIFINASNINGGGGAQVADSVCRYLYNYPQHKFVCVLSKTLENTANVIDSYDNVEVIRYNYPPRDWISFISGRNTFLDNIVKAKRIDCVITIFGPMKWKPLCPHVCGFGLSHIVMPESPYFKRMSFKEKLYSNIRITIWSFIFKRCADHFITENPYISERLQKKFKGKRVFTITNNYNQIFDKPINWKKHKLPEFDGLQLLDIAAAGPHKNQPISLEIAKILKQEHPNFKFRFVFTIEENEFVPIPDSLKDCFYFTGKVDIAECPSLYEQCDIEFQPSLLECFTATYPEAMRMQMPIVTTDLEFARGLCGEAAYYYDSLSPQSAADVIFQLASNEELQKTLITNGNMQLKMFDTSETRANKMIKICEMLGR